MMTTARAREDLDLSAILPRYQEILNQAFDDSILDPPVLDPSLPVQVGGGVLTVSSCTDLEPYPSICWDVNGYYAELGVHWRASRRELRLAYQRLGGPDDPRLTYVFRQLLSPETRRRYDLMPYGTVMLDDYVQAEIIKNATQEAARRTRLGTWTTPEGLLDEWGFCIQDEDSQQTGQDDQGVIPSHHEVEETSMEEGWPYSFLRLGTACEDVDRMISWQRALLKGFSGRRVRFAVGYTGGQSHIGYYKTSYVFFLSDSIKDENQIIQEADKLVRIYYTER